MTTMGVVVVGGGPVPRCTVPHFKRHRSFDSSASIYWKDRCGRIARDVDLGLNGTRKEHGLFSESAHGEEGQ